MIVPKVINREGFTLIEALISIGIWAIILFFVVTALMAKQKPIEQNSSIPAYELSDRDSQVDGYLSPEDEFAFFRSETPPKYLWKWLLLLFLAIGVGILGVKTYRMSVIFLSLVILITGSVYFAFLASSYRSMSLWHLNNRAYAIAYKIVNTEPLENEYDQWFYKRHIYQVKFHVGILRSAQN